MKAVRIHAYGSFEQLRYENVDLPEMGNDQLLVKVIATSVNHLEIKKASGTMKEMMPLTFPWIPGFDFSGIVERTGTNVHGFAKGDLVYGNCMGGSYAEYLVADLDKVAKMPDILSFAEAASVPHVGETAWQALFKHGNLKAGQTVLIHGAAGAVGMFAVQFAREARANILTTVADKDLKYIKLLGANEALDYKTQDFSEVYKDVDLVIVLIGGDTEERSYKVLKPGGRLVSTVGISHPEMAKEKNINAIPMVIEQSAEDLNKITDLIISGKVRTDIGRLYPLQEAAEGWKTMLGDPSVPRLNHGKVILEVNS